MATHLVWPWYGRVNATNPEGIVTEQPEDQMRDDTQEGRIQIGRKSPVGHARQKDGMRHLPVKVRRQQWRHVAKESPKRYGWAQRRDLSLKTSVLTYWKDVGLEWKRLVGQVMVDAIS